MDILTSVAGTVLGYIVVPIGRELGHLFFYKKKIKDLEEQLKTLRDSRERVQSLVNVARSNAYEIYIDVLTWLANVDSELLIPQQNEGGSNRNDSNMSCLNLVQCQPRKTKKRVEDILKLIDNGKKFDKDNVGYPAPLPSTKCSALPTDYQNLKSRTLKAKEIMDALADPNVNKVGVCGMGGVGKTKLLDEVKKLVLENNLFHRVIDVTIGKSKSVMAIQDEIGGMLNMDLNMNSMEVRASRLQTKLVEMEENILIMLDDLWKEYNLEKDFGIPYRSKSRAKGCKILMTSRSQGVLTNQMNAEKLFEVNPLSDEEPWKFFVAIVGESIPRDIEHIARDVVKECGGLPIALKIIAKALKGKKVQVWKDALKKLKKHAFVGIPEVTEELYTCLKISYDSIGNEAKLLFLLCSVFLDDHKIWIKDLQMYAMGMGLLDINNWEHARNRVSILVDDLKSSYLLLKSDKGDDYVQMHDVVRDVAKHIAKIDKMPSLSYECGQSEWREEDRCELYNAIFVDCKNVLDLPPKLEFTDLQLLILSNNQTAMHEVIQIPDAFFEGMKKLRVLDMTKMSFEPSRTLLTHSIKNLQTLCMSNCECNDIDTIGELKKLKILRINGCTIQELPKTMSQLTELKVLEVLDCFKLKVIHPNIISSMTKLEELSLWSSFKRWGEEVSYKNKLIKNVKLSELECLKYLSTLRLVILNVDIMSNELSLKTARKLEEFYFCIGHDHSSNFRHWGSDTYATSLMLNIQSKFVPIGGVLEILLQECEKLYVIDSLAFTKALLKPNGNHGYSRLKYLFIRLKENSEMPHQIIGNITPLFDVQVPFSELKDLTIAHGNNLEMLWHNSRVTANAFCTLQNICIEDCNKLTYLFPSHMVTSLVFLNELKVYNCELLERIFEIEELADDVAKVVSLRILALHCLPNLKHVWNNDPGELLTFPNLKQVEVYCCPQLKSLFPASFIKHMENIESLHTDLENEIFAEDEVSKLVLPEIVVFPSLRTLAIHCKVVEKRRFWVRSESFPKLQRLQLFGSEDDNLVSLPFSELVYRIKELHIREACQLVQVFQNGVENKGAKLKSLHLKDLPNLVHVWEENTEMTSFDSLGLIDVCECENLKCLVPSSSSITFLNLTYLDVRNCNGMMNLFSSSVAKSLVNLEEMRIEGCRGMSSIVVGEGEEEIIFNRMNSLVMSNLPRLASFYSGIKCTLEFPCLKELRIIECPEMEEIETLRTDLENEIFAEEEASKLVYPEIVVFPSLRTLAIQCKVVEKRRFWVRSEPFPKLQRLELLGSKDDGMVSLPLEMSELVYRIEELSIRGAFELVQVFQNGEENNHSQSRAKLKTLNLSNLPNLVHLWEQNTEMTTSCFDSLEYININDCENLKCLVPSSITFFNLRSVRVNGCNGMMNLFSSSVAKL